MDSIIGWDERVDLPIREQAQGHLVVPLGIDSIRQSVPLGEGGALRLETLYEAGESETLIVSLHGALDRTRFMPPRFEWRRTLSRAEAGKLYLADSTLGQSINMEIGWYLGTQSLNLMDACAKHIMGVAKDGGYTKIVCIGSSAGGYGALGISRRIPGAVAVAFSPQTSIAAYSTKARKLAAAVVFPDESYFPQIEEQNIDRFNMRLYYAGTENVNHVYYVQNSGDEFHYSGHYVPFALSLGVDPEKGGNDPTGRHRFVVERQETGHAPPSRGRFLKHLLLAHQEFFGTELLLKPKDIVVEKRLGER